MITLPFFIIIPIIALFFTVVFLRRGIGKAYLGALMCCIGLVVLVLFQISLLQNVPVGVYAIGGLRAPQGITLVCDGLSVFFLLIMQVIFFLCVLYCSSWFSQYKHNWKFYALFLIQMSAINGLLISGDIFTMFIFMEIAALASYALIGFTLSRKALVSSFKYMVAGMFSSCLIFFAIILCYAYLSTLNMADMNQQLLERCAGGPLILKENKVMFFIAGLFLFALGIKMAVVPLHRWFVEAHTSSNYAVSALLSAVLIPALGFYPLLRLFYNVFGISGQIRTFFLVFGMITLLVGKAGQIRSKVYKKTLAYNVVGEAGYFLLALGCDNFLGLIAGMVHLFNFSINNAGLFLHAGMFKSREQGLFYKLSSFSFVFASAGVPPFNNFWSKLVIIAALMQQGHKTLALITLIVSIVGGVYLIKAQKNFFKRKTITSLSHESRGHNALLKISLFILLLLNLLSVLLWQEPFKQKLVIPACKIIQEPSVYARQLQELL